MINFSFCRINEVLFGVTSNDALFSLSSDEVSKLSGGANRMSRLAGHMLLQQTFAPQFPAPSAMLSQVCPSQSLKFLYLVHHHYNCMMCIV